MQFNIDRFSQICYYCFDRNGQPVINSKNNSINEVVFISYESFDHLEETKKLNIINAGFLVFAEHGYAKASVEEIVRAADISKGSLFYYFKTKKNFYLYLYEYSGRQLERIVDSPGPDGAPAYMAYDDFFERLNAIQRLKIKASTEYPHMVDFMKKSVFDTSSEIREDISRINNRYTRERAMLFFQGLDYSKFKEGIEPMMIIQLLTWVSEGCADQTATEMRMNRSGQNEKPNFNRIIELYDRYVTLFRNNFYKEEYL